MTLKGPDSSCIDYRYHVASGSICSSSGVLPISPIGGGQCAEGTVVHLTPKGPSRSYGQRTVPTTDTPDSVLF